VLRTPSRLADLRVSTQPASARSHTDPKPPVGRASDHGTGKVVVGRRSGSRVPRWCQRVRGRMIPSPVRPRPDSRPSVPNPLRSDRRSRVVLDTAAYLAGAFDGALGRLVEDWRIEYSTLRHRVRCQNSHSSADLQVCWAGRHGMIAGCGCADVVPGPGAGAGLTDPRADGWLPAAPTIGRSEIGRRERSRQVLCQRHRPGRTLACISRTRCPPLHGPEAGMRQGPHRAAEDRSRATLWLLDAPAGR